MKIVEKIASISGNLRTNPSSGEDTAKEIQREATLAIQNGMKSSEWETYMKRFATNSKQLQRLTGKDEAFMNEEWGPVSLAYIAGNGLCTMTSFANTTLNMDEDMKAGIDRDLPSDLDKKGEIDSP